ncbi:MAG: hypothetical protein HYS83_01110 [Candidatus Blackburnbacteria bacterium]|nr:hypothetical protein [Candidatus Blackburnbacteria bacterium]
MFLLIKEKAGEEILKEVSEDLNGYIKFVVDVEQEILAAGGKRHFEGEKLLLDDGSKQENLWGGGLDSTGEMDFDSIINLRPSQGNPSREVLDTKLRERITEIVHRLLK